MYQSNNKNKKNGFTLIETIVAITIFTVGSLAAVGVIGQSLKLPKKTQDQVVAAHIAQEGIEIVRNIRDSNFTSGFNEDWDIGIFYGQPTGTFQGCVQYNMDNVDQDCTSFGLGSYVLKFDDANGVFTHDTGVDSQFTRTITITKYDFNADNISDQMLVESDVTWPGGNSVHLQEDLFNWQ